jgi:hypothetical protein
MAVAGSLSFSIVAEFEDGHVMIGCEGVDNFQIVADALKIRECRRLQAIDLHITGTQEWRVLSWNSRFSTALKQITICACSQSGSDAKIGWIGAVSVGRATPVDSAVIPVEADPICISASAVASRRITSFECAPEHEICDIQCVWTQISNSYFPFVDIYLDAKDTSLPVAATAESRIWQGRSASSMFVISNARVSSQLQVVLMGTNCLLQRVELARVAVSVPWARPSSAIE